METFGQQTAASLLFHLVIGTSHLKFFVQLSNRLRESSPSFSLNAPLDFDSLSKSLYPSGGFQPFLLEPANHVQIRRTVFAALTVIGGPDSGEQREQRESEQT